MIRAVDPATHIHPQYNVEVTIEPEDEMSKFVLLSLHGIPKPPKKEQHAEKRADAWYPRFLSGEEGLKHVAINDEMQGGTNLTVRLSFPPRGFLLRLSSVGSDRSFLLKMEKIAFEIAG